MAFYVLKVEYLAIIVFFFKILGALQIFLYFCNRFSESFVVGTDGCILLPPTTGLIVHAEEE